MYAFSVLKQEHDLNSLTVPLSNNVDRCLYQHLILQRMTPYHLCCFAHINTSLLPGLLKQQAFPTF